MGKFKKIILVIGSACLITFLFFKQALGLNLLIFEWSILGWLLVSKQIDLKGKLIIPLVISVLLTSLFTVIHHSLLSFTVNFIVFFLFLGSLIAPEIQSLGFVFKQAFFNLFKSQIAFKDQIREDSNSKINLTFYLKRSRIFLIPIAILIFFIIIYSLSSPKFAELTNNVINFILEKLDFIFGNIDLSLLWTFVLGLLISNLIFNRVVSKNVIEQENLKNDHLFRIRTIGRRNFQFMGLKNEYRAAIFLFLSLNFLLLILNITDINLVWFNFEWKGEYLKQFVHEGTYFLILSILISIVLVLWFFRRNINFYSKNRTLKLLCYTWIVQNMILAISVSIRNIYYIHYFALAYKRIAIVFFLILVIYGLFTVYQKVKNCNSTFFLIRKNSFSFLIVLVIASAFNWDTIIAKYNFRHADRSFVHLNFLAQLSDSSLPYLDKSFEEVTQMDLQQTIKYSFISSSGSYERVYMTPKEYVRTIKERKERFKKKWKSKGFLSWNYAEAQAYKQLFE